MRCQCFEAGVLGCVLVFRLDVEIGIDAVGYDDLPRACLRDGDQHLKMRSEL